MPKFPVYRHLNLFGEIACKTPTLKYGRIRSRQRGRVIKYLCNPGYQLAGEKTSFCINGTWDVNIPKCVRGSCAKAETAPTNGIVIPTHNGAVLNFYCKQGYELNGPITVYCDGFRWDSHKPSCIPSDEQPSLFCDFEDENICHWSHDLNHDMDWQRDSYRTPTGYSMPTGPSFDHTKGNGSGGYYMYIESSSRRINDTARLISPIFEATNSSTCLEFWYHMYGRSTGTLKAYIKKVSDLWPLNPGSALFTKSGDQGNVWYRAFVDLGVLTENFQIIMEGIRGNGYVSDTAIDDVNIIPNCNYDDYLLFSTEPSAPVSETFKSIESCENRCGLKAFHNDSQVINCDCDEFCYETSQCCPDYVDFCLSGSTDTDWSTTTEIISEEPLNTTQNIITNKTAKVVVPTKKSTTRPTSTIKIIPTMKSTLKLTSTTKSTLKLTQSTTTTKKPTTNPKPKIINPVSTKPLIFLKPSTTPEVVQKIIPKFPQSKNSSKIVFVKPKTTTPKQSYNDDIALPKKYDISSEEDSNDINESLQDKEESVEKISNVEKDYPIKIINNSENVGEIKTEFSQIDEDHPSNLKLTFVVIASICGVALFGILTGVALVKLRFVQCRNQRIRSGQGDSQSDVRFLTADEILDFSLDKDYVDDL
ncbi:unnamed protein product [Ceutorhynchus assimilis]|uniref:Uncharacterized protein n=1 Tax=Ceutorhynchus assimilis TaxID=467358 RepID=A0A9N9QRA0_9CUCU|nr:unnamed protein product [Ceutorhynchus assimilis]